jgi:hypothetical protein
MNKKFVGFGIAIAALVAAVGVQQAQAATEADTDVNLIMQSYAAISSTPSIDVTPTLAQIVTGTVTSTNDPIALTIDSTNGSTVTVEGNGSIAGEFTLDQDDLELNAGSGWVNAGVGGTLYSSSATQSAANVPVNVRISNLSAYEVGTHSTTVTFTVVDSD